MNAETPQPVQLNKVVESKGMLMRKSAAQTRWSRQQPQGKTLLRSTRTFYQSPEDKDTLLSGYLWEQVG